MTKKSDAKITTEEVKNAAQVLDHLNPSAEEICWSLGISKPSQIQIATVEKNLHPPQKPTAKGLAFCKVMQEYVRILRQEPPK